MEAAPSAGKRVRASREWLSFTYDWSRKWAKLFNQAESAKIEITSKHELLPTLNRKPLQNK